MSGIERADVPTHSPTRANATHGNTFLHFPHLDPLSIRFLLEQPSGLQERSITTAKSAALVYDENRARFVSPKLEETGRLETHTVTTLTVALLQSISPNPFRNRTFPGGFRVTID